MDERAAFEKAIDDNPLESTNHLVYADWLDEHGEHDEAAFRREMGKLAGENIDYKDLPKIKSAPGKGFRHYVNGLEERYHQPFGSASIKESDYPKWAVGRLTGGASQIAGTRRYYPTYRHLETSLRNAFMQYLKEQRQQTNPEQMSRRRNSLKQYKKS